LESHHDYTLPQPRHSGAPQAAANPESGRPHRRHRSLDSGFARRRAPRDHDLEASDADLIRALEKENRVELLEAAVIGTGWCGGIRAETLSRSALCKKLHVCEIRPDRLAEIKALTKPATATLDYQDIVANKDISVVYICTTPEQTHFPITRDCLRAGKHVLLEKPIAMELFEADELIATAKRVGVKFTIGYSQRFNTKIAYAKKKIADGTLGRPVSLMVSRHLSRSLGKRIAGRTRLSPAAMESTHDLDFVFWMLEPAKPVRVYSQGAYGYMKDVNGSFDMMWTTVTMDNGALVAIGGGWNLPPSYPNYCATWIEITGTEGSLFLDDTQRDNWLNTVGEGTRFPMSTMPGEQVDHVFAGQMGPETLHFLESVMLDRPPMVAPESARRVMECYLAADLSAERGEPIDIPMNNEALAAVQDLYKKFRTPL
jgi:predicted dehydrogenase